MASTMQLEFSQAMSDFKTMFPEMESDVIEAVLRANSGAVDATIDALLQMSTDNQNEKLRNELDSNGTPEKRANLLNLGDEGGGGGVRLVSTSPTGASPKIRKPIIGNAASPRKISNTKWVPPLLGPLPPTFLRISVPGGVDFNLDDEQVALMLQNEEFMNELRWNQEFLRALEKDKVQEDVPFKDRLRNMGKSSKKKFVQMARVFTFQRNKKPGTNPGLLQEEHSDDDEPKKK